MISRKAFRAAIKDGYKGTPKPQKPSDALSYSMAYESGQKRKQMGLSLNEAIYGKGK